MVHRTPEPGKSSGMTIFLALCVVIFVVVLIIVFGTQGAFGWVIDWFQGGDK